MADTCVSNVANNTEETRSDALGMLFVIARAAFFIYLISSSLISYLGALFASSLFAAALLRFLPLLHGPAVLRLVLQWSTYSP